MTLHARQLPSSSLRTRSLHSRLRRRSLELLAPLNAVGVAAIALLAAVAAGLAAQGVARGSAFPLPLLPQWQLLGPTPGAQLQALTAVLPVLIACYVAHQSVHPLMLLLRPYSTGRMRGVAAGAVSIACLVFTTLALGAALAFGPALDVSRVGLLLCCQPCLHADARPHPYMVPPPLLLRAVLAAHARSTCSTTSQLPACSRWSVARQRAPCHGACAAATAFRSWPACCCMCTRCVHAWRS